MLQTTGTFQHRFYFSGAEGVLTFRDGQVSANIEFGLEGVPSDEFALVLFATNNDAAELGSATRATVTIIGEIGMDLEKTFLVQI